MKVFLDSEFTGLTRDAELISLAMVDENGREFYAEFNDYEPTKVNEWVQAHVIAKLDFINVQTHHEDSVGSLKLKADRKKIADEINAWLAAYPVVEIWADVLAWDWMLFCDLFGGAFGIPENIFYAPFDLATALRLKGLIEPEGKYKKDVSRFELAGLSIERQHHALEDARAELYCFQMLK